MSPKTITYFSAPAKPSEITDPIELLRVAHDVLMRNPAIDSRSAKARGDAECLLIAYGRKPVTLWGALDLLCETRDAIRTPSADGKRLNRVLVLVDTMMARVRVDRIHGHATAL